MKSEILRYRLESGAGGYTKLFAGVIIVGGVILIQTSLWAGLAFMVVGIIPFLLYKCLEFDLYKGSYCMGLNFAGYTLGEKEPFPGVEYLFLKRNKTISRSNRRTWTSTYAVSFDGYILLADGVKLLVVQEGTKDRALQQLQLVARDLQTEIRDLTGTRAV